MNISLTPHLEKLVQGKVKSGLYNSASEVMRELFSFGAVTLGQPTGDRNAQIFATRKSWG